MSRPTILGYARPDGKVGIRNHLLVMSTVVCSSFVARRIADQVQGAVAIENPFGCGQLEPDLEVTRRTLIGMAKNPNVGGVLVVGLGCEQIQADDLVKEIEKTGKPVEKVVVQEVDGGTPAAIEKGVTLLRRMAEDVLSQKPEEVDVSNLVMGVECGGSDATSGLASNPVVGYASDKLIDLGGTVILSETPEMIGAEEILARRAVSREVGDRIIRVVRKWVDLAASHGVDLVGTQPAPGNIAGGISTIEEKSLGAIIKGGSRAIQGVVDYAEEVKGKGLWIMDTPGYDIMSVVGMVAGGATLVVFTTGRGTPTGNPIAPVIKVTANPFTAKKMRENMDFDASTVTLGQETIEQAGEKLFKLIMDVARGKPTRAELLGFREFVIHKIIPSF
ncbi:UxaA family hydrolase [Vulcanisaeta souniana]|uniref:Carbohydrate hydrolase n=1 Tax=Vulcanisaeta souniana JCM 11219 TaxID=1293586 RepID=A0A830EH58_9CREN|nr:UxaA family hydrolase [Vulcanisaeta souniana]BDR92622.1 carbohydrate hydrolase [Vulcanisaeta souniana JCM 11219]GGI82452.1 carbohydrate hydrolase [Vulcanisaeta souniana JCM 11219]